MTTTVGAPAQRAAQRGEVALWGLAVVAGGMLFPGLGIIVGLVLAVTRLKHNSLTVRLGLVGLGLVVLVAQIVGLMSGSVEGGVGSVLQFG
ncbi:hypothetical protein ACIQNU_11960 [Streptomyces sp. NPDC091292]|uniref:hypothetical protein n=1 Tax=Streptomyces sp. NPDC091292 TaxID=3365991 RepID=UPI0037F288B3